MDMGENNDISKLLRLKRYEQPPPGYYDNFLHEFHRRQRTEMMRPSFWETVWDRLSTIAPTFRVPQFAYGMMAALAVMASILIVMPREDGATASGYAQNTAEFSPVTSRPVTISGSVPVSTSGASSLPPHYVLESQPVSNERPLSF